MPAVGKGLAQQIAFEAEVINLSFRRLVVHTVRIADAGTDAAALLEGYARGSGGTSDWSVRAPPR